MPTTPQNGLPSPDDQSPNQPYLHIKNLADALDSRLVPRFDNDAARDAAITSPQDGQVCFIKRQTSPVVLPGRMMFYYLGAWRLLGPSPLQPVSSPFSEAAGSFGTSPTTLTTLTIPYVGFPFMVSALARAEVGSTQAGTRWDTQVTAQQGSGTVVLLDYYEGIDGTVSYHRMSQSGPNGAVFTGDVTIRFQALRPVGSALGQINSPGNRVLAAWCHAA